MRYSIIFLVIALLSLTVSSNVFGDNNVSPNASDDAALDINKVPPILDPEFRHRKQHQFEFSVYGGSYLGDTLGQTWIVGPKAYYHFNNTVAVGAAYGFSRLLTDDTSGFGSSLNNHNMHLVDAEASLSNDAAFRVGKKLVEMDFYLTLGAGSLIIDSKWEPVGLIGGGIKIYPGIPWLAFRIDVNNLLHYVNWPNDSQFDCDVLFLGGISFLFPSNPSPYEK